MRLRSNQHGDTIIEVLIALSVLSLILVAGYSISTRSINGVRVSQERSEALKIAESQLEQLRGLTSRAATAQELNTRGLIIRKDSLGDGVVFTGDKETFAAFCITSSSSTVIKYNLSGAFTDFSQYTGDAEQCVVDDRYHVAIVPRYSFVKKGADAQIAISYQVNVYWDRIGGGEVQSLSLAYKLTVPEK